MQKGNRYVNGYVVNIFSHYITVCMTGSYVNN
ncbi:hypothetical protein K0038_02337 [Pseudomonas syringae]|nr:hypothetical protein [Pseudomonas syringae]